MFFYKDQWNTIKNDVLISRSLQVYYLKILFLFLSKFYDFEL